MKNADNLRTLTGPKATPAKPKPVPDKQNNPPASSNLLLITNKRKKKKRKTFYPSSTDQYSWMRTLAASKTQIPNPIPHLQLFTPSNIVTIRPPGQVQTGGSGPNNTTGPVNTQGQISGSESNKQTEPIKTPSEIKTSGPTNPSKAMNPPGQSTGSGPNTPSWSVNPVDQKSGNGTTGPGPKNTISQTSGSGPSMPNWSTNTPAQTTGVGPKKPSWSINTSGQMSGTSNPSGPRKVGPRFQPPQKEQPVVDLNKPIPKMNVMGDGAKGISKEASWMNFLRDVGDGTVNKNQQVTQNWNQSNQNAVSAQNLTQNPESIAQTPKTVVSNTANNINIYLNKAAFSQQQNVRRKPRIPDPHTFWPGYPKGIPRSFLTQAPQGNFNLATNITTSYEMPAWLSAPPNVEQQAMVANNPVFVQTDTPTDVQQPYSPSDAYEESSFGDDHEGSETSEAGQSAQKRLSAFQRLGPLSQPKKPKLTINLMFNKEQAVRFTNLTANTATEEVVDVTEEDTEKYTAVHLRQNFIASTDETVVKFLPSWPWKKRVPLRKSVTARHSKSVMILEQEQMEEIYDKDNVFMQVTVKGYPKYWNKEHVLDALLEVAKGKSFIPCFTEITEDECKFLVLRSRSALVMIHKCGFVIRKDDVELTIVISYTDVSLKQIDFIPRLVLRKRLMMGYDGERKLNLKEFTLKDDISHFIYYPLNRLSNQMELIQLQSTIAWDYLTDLDLSYNRLTSVSGFDLPSTTPRLKHLNLSHNHIERVTELLKCRDLSIHSIWLEGNPLCLDYIDSQHYIKVVKMMFNSVQEIDGVPITLRGDMPSIKRNYCPEDAEEFVEKFLEIYFPLLDTTPDDRPCIQNLYTDNATMTITYRNKLRHSPVYRCFRNLFLRSRAFEEGEMDAVETSSSIVKLINRWPEFEHDPLTFTVDVLHYDDFSAILRVSGIVKLKAESLAEDEHLLAFTKTFVLQSKDGVDYKIQNELVYWDHPTEEYAATAFKVTTVKLKQLSFKLDSTPSEDLKDKLLDLFMNLTTLKRKASERCLELKNWNFKDALEHFTKLLKLDSLESLTRDEV